LSSIIHQGLSGAHLQITVVPSTAASSTFCIAAVQPALLRLSENMKLQTPLFRLTIVSGIEDVYNAGAVTLRDVMSGDWSFAMIVCFIFDLKFMTEQCPRLQEPEVNGKVLLVTSALDSLFPAGAHKLLRNPQVRHAL
jgi:hypothetical protein